MSAIPRLAENSPTASLLRNSRLFSLPKRLPRPDMSERIQNAYKNSETASTYYPTHQVIATPASSRQRGDWGLKRPLPLRTTSKSYAVRLDVLDTCDGVTEFETAHGHTKTLEKLQELNVAISRPGRGYDVWKVKSRFNRDKPAPNSFDSAFDNTAPVPKTWEENKSERLDLDNNRLRYRWRQRGKDLRQLPDAEFEKYLNGQIQRNQKDFLRFLKAHYIKTEAENKLQSQEVRSIKEAYFLWLKEMNHGDLVKYLTQVRPDWLSSDRTVTKAQNKPWVVASSPEVPDLISFWHHWSELEAAEQSSASEPAQDVAEVQAEAAETQDKFLEEIIPGWTKYLLTFRNSSALNDEYRGLLEYYLDLAQTIPDGQNDMPQPSTHPSAGISYRRTSSTLPNHPVFGPLGSHDFTRARAIPNSPMASRVSQRQASPTVFGLGGLIVSSRDKAPVYVSNHNSLTEMMTRGDGTKVERRGMPKGYASVQDVHVNHEGRINMTVRPAKVAFEMIASGQFNYAEAVKRGKEAKEKGIKNPLDERTEYKAKRVKPFNFPSAGLPLSRE